MERSLNFHLGLLLLTLFALMACRLPQPLSVSPSFTPTVPAGTTAVSGAAPPAQRTPTSAAPRPTASIGALAGQTLRDVVYCTLDGQDLVLDLYFPSESAAPWPVVMYIHGGAWSAGDKRSGAGYVEVPALREAGFVVAAVNYRLAPRYTFPAMIEDVKCAVRFLRAHAADYGLDPDHVGVWGGSAGGHLAALLGTSDASAGWDVGPYPDQSSRVQAVVDMFGPADLARMAAQAATNPRGAPRLLTIFDATSPDDPALAVASPVTYVIPIRS